MRQLSLHERFSVSRRNVHFPPVVVAAAILELDIANGDSLAELGAELSGKIDHLLVQYPLLSCKVVDSRTKTPSWAAITPAPTAQDVLVINNDQGSTLDSADEILSEAVSVQLSSICTTSDGQQGPLWKVHLSPLNAQRCVVTLTCDHVINDGRGTLTLFQLLLKRDQPEPDIVINMADKPSSSSSKSLQLPPPSEKVFDFRPSTTYMLGMIFHELILPVLPLPSWVKDKLRGPAAWPVTPLKGIATASLPVLEKSPRECSTTTKVCLFSGPNFINNLKTSAQAHINIGGSNPKAASLHAIIHSLAIAALFAALADAEPALEEFELCYGSETPVSLRHSPADFPSSGGLCTSSTAASSSPELPMTTGNFVSCFQYSTQVRGSHCFWTTTNDFARQLSSKAGRTAAKHTMGMLAYIPDPNMSSANSSNYPSEKTEMADAVPVYRTGWEKYFGVKSRSPTPFGSSVEISNLGLIDVSTMRRNVVACTWAQFKAPVSSAFNMDVIGYTSNTSLQTLSIALGARPTAFADKHVFQRFHANLVQLVNMFGNASAPTGQISFADLIRLLD